MKKIIVILATVFAINFFNYSVVEGATVTGKAPDGIANQAQARILAKRAAQVLAIKNNGGKVPQIISESWDSETKEYTIEFQ